jgi:hypothetical protein
MYTHELKTSGIKCFKACWWPTKNTGLIAKEQSYPMMHLETGQVIRVNVRNLKKVKKQYTDQVVTA